MQISSFISNVVYILLGDFRNVNISCSFKRNYIISTRALDVIYTRALNLFYQVLTNVSPGIDKTFIVF